jgi:hypothetical protein
MKPRIFEQEQIARAVELGLGVASPEQIRLVAADSTSLEYRNKIDAVLRQG